MKFLPRSKKKTFIVLSDLHLSAGIKFEGKKNVLEDFHSDRELIELLRFYSNGAYNNRNVELVINGDFLDFLAVPYVPYFDDEFWHEKASVEKIKIILKAHQDVFFAIEKFLKRPNKKFIYILGNHDAEMIFDGVKNEFLNFFSEEAREQIELLEEGQDYIPYEELVIRHGHQYEEAHSYNVSDVLKIDENGEKMIIPPWGFLYVTRVVNRFKEDRSFIDSIRPIKTFMIYGLIFDTLFTARFILANIFYFFVVILGALFREGGHTFREIVEKISSDLELFKEYEDLTLEEFQNNPKLRVLVLGHTHIPTYSNIDDSTILLNTGSWVEMFHLDFRRRQNGRLLTYAQIDVRPLRGQEKHDIDASLRIWKGHRDAPFDLFY